LPSHKSELLMAMRERAASDEEVVSLHVGRKKDQSPVKKQKSSALPPKP